MHDRSTRRLWSFARLARPSICILGILLSFVLPLQALAQQYEGTGGPASQDSETAKLEGWSFSFVPYLWLPEINGGNGPRRQAAERAAINAPMQGTAADLIKMSMIAVQKWIEESKVGTRMIMQVHDELILEVPDAELSDVRKRLPELMCGVAALKVPLVAEVGAGLNWEEAH